MSEDDKTSRMIAQLWQKNQPLILERLAQIDQAASAAAAGTLEEDQRAAAESTAHKLSGSLGMFGYQQGTEFARALEAELQAKDARGQLLVELARNLRSSLGFE